MSFVPIIVTRGPELNRNIFFRALGPIRVNYDFFMFSSVKMEKYMEYELSGIF